VRGSSLAYPPVLDRLRPFLVTYASARRVEDFPEDVLALLGPANRRPQHLNLGLMVLDPDGKVLRQATPYVRPPAFQFDPEAQGKDFLRQVDDLLAGLTLPAAPKGKAALALPDVAGKEPLAGVRVYLTFGANRLNHYRTPTVEAVKTTKELRQALRYPTEATTWKATALWPWLEQIYPPAIMDGKGGFDRIEGELTFKPAGRQGDTRWALVEGDVAFALDNMTKIAYTGRLSVAVEYGADSDEAVAVRGVCECVFPKHNPQGQVVERIRMTAAIESRPR